MDLSKFICCLILSIIIILTALFDLIHNQHDQFYIFKSSKSISSKKQNMPPILIWNKCIRVASQGIGYPDYPVINSTIKCPFNCTFTTDRKLYVWF
uniref:Candidate secreted effector n=1 Tax=Meloidogyne incognita TaxID=6306 RepID=A0A914LGL2_MELIC